MKISNKLSPISLAVLLAMASNAQAGAKIDIDEDTYINVGAGLRTAFTVTEEASNNGENPKAQAELQSIRLYVSGQINPDFKFTFNTENIAGEYSVLDGIVQYEPSEAFNVWLGRMLTPADRIEMNGPYYALSWNQYTVPLYPSDQGGEAGRFGRDEGLTVWGTLGSFQYAVGAFDGYQGESNGDSNLLYAGRFAYNFLNMEGNPAYYTSSTYYGKAGDVLTLGLSYQYQEDGAGTAAKPATFQGGALDLLFEKVMGDAGVFTLEGEYKQFDCDCAGASSEGGFELFDGDSYFATVAYLVPGDLMLQPYVRYTENSPSEGDSSSLSEFGLNYIIDGHNLRLNANYTTGDANLTGAPGADVGSFSLGMQVQL